MVEPVAVLAPSPGGLELNLCTATGPAVLNDPPLGSASVVATDKTIPNEHIGGCAGAGEGERQRPGDTLDDGARQCGVTVPPACKLHL